MSDDSDFSPRRSRRKARQQATRNRAGRKVSRQRRAWYTQMAILVPVLACLGFGGLIAGLLLAWNDSASDQPAVQGATSNNMSAESRQLNGTASLPVAGGIESAASLSVGEDSLESSEPNVPVLNMVEAKKPGRTLRHLLIVGKNPRMYPTISAALEVAIPGDIIEVRTNQPVLEPGVVRKLSNRILNAPIVIRAARGMLPVIRSGLTTGPLFQIQKVDVLVQGLHLASATGGAFFALEDGSLTMQGCTVTGVLPVNATSPAAPIACILRSTRRSQAPLSVIADRCFFTNHAGIVDLAGPDVHVKVSHCLLNGRMFPISVILNENQSLEIDNCTCVGTYVMGVALPSGGPAKFPDEPFIFRMNGSIFGLIACCASLVELNFPEDVPLSNPNEVASAVRMVFRDISGPTSVSPYWAGWGHVNGGNPQNPVSVWLREIIFPNLPQNDQTLRYGPRFEQARELIHVKNDMASATRLLLSASFEDFIATSQGPLAELRGKGIPCGCDIRLLLVPPPGVFETYDLPQ